MQSLRRRQHSVIQPFTSGKFRERSRNQERGVLATQACRHGLSVRYFRTSRLLEALNIAHGDGRFIKLIAQLAKTDVLVLDDWGLEKMTLSQRNDVLEIMEDRHGLKSTIVTSQLPITQWQKAIGDATLADAILDRLLHNSHKLKLKGASYPNRGCKTVNGGNPGTLNS